MTDPRQRLNTEVLFEHKPLTLHRIARRRFSPLSGTGAALYKGRWNVTGQRAVYTSIEKGTTILERLVHTPKDRVPSGLALMSLQLAGQWVKSATHLFRDEKTKAEFFVFPSLAEGESFHDAIHKFSTAYTDFPVAIAIPSIVVPVWNVVLYPGTRGFKELVSVTEVDGFEFDPRLFPDEAIPEME